MNDIENRKEIVRQYKGNNISFAKSNGIMVNATEMAKPFGKSTKDWMVNKSTTEFLNELSSVRGIPLSQLVVVKKGNSSQFDQGTWMHEDVALEFARWLSPKFAIWCNDQIKELIATGSVSLNIPKTFSEALRLAADQQEQIEKQQKLIEEQRPKVEFFDAVADSKTAVSMEEAAKSLNIQGIGRNNLFKFLRCNKILMDSNLPYQEYIDRGYFRVIEQKYSGKDGMPKISYKTLVYQRGLDFIRKMLHGAGFKTEELRMQKPKLIETA